MRQSVRTPEVYYFAMISASLRAVAPTGSRLFPKVLVEKTRNLAEGFLGLRSFNIPGILSVRLRFINLQDCLDAGLAQLAMHAHGIAQEKITRSGSENRRREPVHIAEDWREHRILKIVTVCVE